MLLAVCASVLADDYVDDVYYSETTALKEQLETANLTPYYNTKAMEELVFFPDTLQTDTIGH